MSDLPAILAFFLVPVALYVVPTLIARSLIKPDRRWSSDAPLLFVLFALGFFSLITRGQDEAGIFNLLLEPALLTAAPIAFWLLFDHRFVARLKLGGHVIGPDLLGVLIGAAFFCCFSSCRCWVPGVTEVLRPAARAAGRPGLETGA